MGFFPYQLGVSRNIESDVDGLPASFAAVAVFNYATSPLAAVTNKYVTSTNMKVGAYTLAATAPGDGLAHHVTITHTTDTGADTLGTIAVVGTDLSGATITDTITPLAGTIAHGVKAFKTITSITGAGWVISGGNDTIVVGFGDKLGLPHKLGANTVLYCSLNGVREATAPTVTYSSTVLSQNTLDLNSALNASAVEVAYVVL